MIVEFIGPSGAGKTTLIRGVQRRLSERGIACRIRTTYMGLDWENPRTRRGFGKWRELGRAVLTQPRLSLWCLFFWCRVNARRIGSASAPLRARNMGWLLGASYYGKEYKSDAGVQLHDEGPLKVSANLAARSPSLTEGLDRKLSLPDLTVALTVDPEVAFKRVHQRGHDHLSFETIDKWVKAQEKGIKIVAKWGPTFLADTSHDEDYAEEVAELIARHYRGMTGQDDENSVVTASS